MEEEDITEVMIVGAGLGGLLTGAILSREGYKVTILERLNFIGGRFTSFDKDGVPIPTGAVHMIPCRWGPMKRTLIDRLGLPIDLIDIGRPAIIGKDGEQIELGASGATKLFIKSLLRFSYATRVMNSIYEFSMGLKGHEIPLRERVAFMLRAREYSHHVTPRGGTKTVIDALVKDIRDNNGIISINHEVESIRVVDSGFKTNARGNEFSSDIVVANCRPPALFSLLGDDSKKLGSGFRKRVEKNRPVPGIKVAVVCDHRVCPSSITFTPFLQVISGFSEPTVADPELAGGKHLLLSHQELRPGPVDEQINAAIEDFRRFIPDFDESCQVIATQVFRGVYPVNHASQGHDFAPVTAIPGLCIVGDGVKPKGHIMTEGVARSVEIAIDHILGGV